MKRAAAALVLAMMQGCAQPQPVESVEEISAKIDAQWAKAARPAPSKAELEAERHTREREKKLNSCRSSGQALIGMTRKKLKAKCGLAYPINRTTTARGVREQWVYGYPGVGTLLTVYLVDGVVTAVQD